MDVSYLCFPDFGIGMLMGRGTANFPLHISILPSEKANLANLKYFFSYTMSADGTVLEKMDRYTIEFPFALTENSDPTLQQVLQNEVTKDSYTFEYYK